MNQLTDAEFAAQFEACKLDPGSFTHRAHIRLAWIYLRQSDLTDAIDLISRQIARYDRVHGDGTKFHQTLTTAAVLIVHHFLQRSRATTFPAFVEEFPVLTDDFRKLLSAHYSMARLTDANAKTTFLTPDLQPFPGLLI